MTRQRIRTIGSRRRMRVAGALGALAVILAACGGGGASTTAADDPTPASEATPATTAGAAAGDPSTTTTASANTEATTGSTSDPNAPAAPDFTLALGEGGEFVLSAETRPVYLVFWAEW